MSPTTAESWSNADARVSTAPVPAGAAPTGTVTVIQQKIVYRVVMRGVRPGFSRLDVLRSVAHLFGQTPHRLANGLKRSSVSRRLASAQAATRMAELLTDAGCSCSIEVFVDGAWGSEPALGAVPTTHRDGTRPAAPTLARERTAPATRLAPVQKSAANLRDRVIGAARSLPHFARTRIVPPARQFIADAREAMNRPFGEAWTRMSRYWTPGVQQFVFAFGALGTLALLTNALPGYSIAHSSGRSAVFAASDHAIPLAPVVDLREVDLAAGLPDAGRPVHAVRTTAGEITLEPDRSRPRTWGLFWNGMKLRDMHVDSVPTIMTRATARRPEVAVGEFADEVVIVVDTGERRSAYCAASRTVLVVLPRKGIPRLQEVIGQCAELENVVVADRRLLLHFYDRAAPSLVYQSGRLTRMVN